MRFPTIATAAVLTTALQARSLPLKNTVAGTTSAGGRSSLSLFNDGHGGDALNGVGGQFRVRLSERVNTDRFYDYFSGAIGADRSGEGG